MKTLTVMLQTFATLLLCNIASAAKVTVEQGERGAVIQVDGQPFAEYLTLSGHQPAVWPIVGPTGATMTRSYPAGPLLGTETDDHPHHHSLWFAHEDVNGHNFWAPRVGKNPPTKRNVIEHVEFTKLASEDNTATLVTKNRWVASGDKLICTDERTLVFGADQDSDGNDVRWIDFTIKLIAGDKPVTIGDIKDGTFAVRVAGTMKVNSGGTIVNSVGQRNAKAWGMPAEWVDYYGPVGEKDKQETVGLAIFNSPRNFQHPCRWHVRNYGLFCANPFGHRQFPECDIKQSARTIPAGESLTLSYRVLLHQGDTQQAKIAEAYEAYEKEITK